jgi:Rv2258c-like winged HTH domain/Methyltransferase domain
LPIASLNEKRSYRDRRGANTRVWPGLIGTFSGAVLTYLIGVGHETGLFDAAAEGPATSSELADRAQLNERYVREWLGAMTTGGVFSYDANTMTYELPAEHAAWLTGHTAGNAAPVSQILNHFGTLLPRLIECFRRGGGIPYSEFRPEFTDRMDDVWRRIYDEKLLDGFIAPVPRLRARLEAGIMAADVGCGTGHAVNLLARAYPASRFVGYDIAPDAIAAATAEAEAIYSSAPDGRHLPRLRMKRSDQILATGRIPRLIRPVDLEHLPVRRCLAYPSIDHPTDWP